MILLSFLIPLLFFTIATSKPAPKKIKYTQGKIYSVILLDKNGNEIKNYTYIK
jgi:hypothetical protein